MEAKDINKFERPLFSVFVKSSVICGLEVSINGIPITSQEFYNGDMGATHIPVNHMLIPGQNDLKLDVWETKPLAEQLDSEQSDCQIAFVTRDGPSESPASENAVSSGKIDVSIVAAHKTTSRMSEAKELSTEQIRHVVSGDIGRIESAGQKFGAVTGSFDPEYAWTLKRQFDPGFTVPTPKWIDSPIMPDTQETHRRVFEYYKAVWAVLESKDFKKWRALNSEKAAELAAATGAHVGDVLDTTGLTESVVSGQDESWKLQPLTFEETQIRLHADGRLVSLLTNDWAPALRYGSEIDSNFEFSLPLLLRVDGGALKISR